MSGAAFSLSWRHVLQLALVAFLAIVLMRPSEFLWCLLGAGALYAGGLTLGFVEIARSRARCAQLARQDG